MNTIFWLSIAGAIIGWLGFAVDVAYCGAHKRIIESSKVEVNFARPLWIAVICTIVALTIRG